MAAAPAPRGPAAGASQDALPLRRGQSAVLLSLILVAAVANLNLAVANVALPVIGDAFDASQTCARSDLGRVLARPGRVRALPGRGR